MAALTRLFSPLLRNSVVRFGVHPRFLHAEAKIASLGLKLPTLSTPKGIYVNVVQVNNLLFVSGHLPQPADGDLIIGIVGKEVSIEQGNYHVYIYCFDSLNLFII